MSTIDLLALFVVDSMSSSSKVKQVSVLKTIWKIERYERNRAKERAQDSIGDRPSIFIDVNKRFCRKKKFGHLRK